MYVNNNNITIINLINVSFNQVYSSIKDCFVTGEWKESENAQTLLKMDDDDDLYGDFEDLESGKKFTADSTEVKNDEVDESK